jgi:hypothetical protein
MVLSRRCVEEQREKCPEDLRVKCRLGPCVFRPHFFEIQICRTFELQAFSITTNHTHHSKDASKEEGRACCAGEYLPRSTGPRRSANTKISNTHEQILILRCTNRRTRLRRRPHLRFLQRHLRPRHRSYVRLKSEKRI